MSLFRDVVVAIHEHCGALLFFMSLKCCEKMLFLNVNNVESKDLAMVGRGFASDDESFASTKLFAQFWARYITLHFSL
jgi:hypothetical protein